MAETSSSQEFLENAYRLTTPEDNLAYYRRFADAYDAKFVAELGYVYPWAVAAAYRAEAGKNDVPIADIGCGTGAVAEALKLPAESVDGLDISPDMLRIAGGKRLYRALHAVDLTCSLDALSGRYGAVLSAGTFTHGHLGPGPLRGLLTLARPDALFVIGVNEAHFESLGFAAALEAMTAEAQIGAVRIERARIYARDDHEHAGTMATILTYRKL